MSQPRYSPDGKWWWDGQKWFPAPEPPPPPKPGGLGHKTTVVIIIIGFLAMSMWLVAAAMARHSEYTANASSATDPTQTSATAPWTPGCSPAPCATTDDGVVLLVRTIEWDVHDGWKAPAGEQLVRVGIQIQNTGSKTANFNPNDLKLRDNNRIERTYTWGPPALGMADMASGGRWGPGTLTFAAAADSTAGVLIWDGGDYRHHLYYFGLDGPNCTFVRRDNVSG